MTATKTLAELTNGRVALDIPADFANRMHTVILSAANDVDRHRDEIRSRARHVRDDMDRLLAQLDEDRMPNSCGVLQSSSMLEVAVGQLVAAEQALKMMVWTLRTAD